MPQRIKRNTMWGKVIIAGLLSFLTATPYAYPEAYVGGQIGTTIMGNKLKSVELTDFSPPGSMSDRELAKSALFGFKVGYYFPRARWFGIETEFYQISPHIKQQNTTISIAPGAVLKDFGTVPGGTAEGTLSGDYFRVRTWVPVNFMFRYHKTRLQPYIGFGPGIFMAHIKTTTTGFEGTQDTTSIGFNAKAGIEYFITRNLSAFGEWKHNRTTFKFDANNNGGFGFQANYNPHFIAVGLNYHF